MRSFPSSTRASCASATTASALPPPGRIGLAYFADERGRITHFVGIQTDISERIAAATFDVATRADLALDLHQGSTSRMIDEVRVRCGPRHRLHRECLELAKTFDCGYVLDQKGPDGQLARAAPDEGIPTIDPELGGCVGWDRHSIDLGTRGVMGRLEEMGVV